MDTTDLSRLIISSRQQGRIHPSSPGLQLVGLNAGERDWSVNWGVCEGGNDPKMKCFRGKQSKFIRKRRYNRESKICIWEQKWKRMKDLKALKYSKKVWNGSGWDKRGHKKL